MDIKFDILILLNMASLQKLVLASGAIFRGNTVMLYTQTTHVIWV